MAFCVDDFLFWKTFIYLKYLLKVKLSLFRLISQALLCNFSDRSPSSFCSIDRLWTSFSKGDDAAENCNLYCNFQRYCVTLLDFQLSLIFFLHYRFLDG